MNLRTTFFLLLAFALQQVGSWTTLLASDTNVFLATDGLQSAIYTATGVKVIGSSDNANYLLGANSSNSVLAIAVHHMEYVLDPTLRPVIRLVAYKKPTKTTPGVITATLVEFTEFEHVFNLNNLLVMRAYGTGLTGVNGASLDAIINLTYIGNTNGTPAQPTQVTIQPLGLVKPNNKPSFKTPSTLDEGAVLLTTDDPAHPILQVDVTGTGTWPVSNCNVNLSSTLIDFGTLTVGATNTQPLILRNNGSLPCTVNGILLNGGSAFSVTAPATPFTLATNNAITVLVRYTPITNASDSAVLRISSTDPSAPQQYVNLSGDGTTASPANITVSPGLLNFGSVQIGTNRTLNVSIINSGGTTGAVTTLALATFSTNFTYAPPAPFNLPPSSTQTVAVTYQPVDTSASTGALQIQDTDPNNPFASVSLIATGITPVCSLQIGPTSLNFGAVTNGGILSLPVSVTNNGLASCSITSIGYTGSPDFTNLPAVILPIVLPPGATTNLSFSFMPTGGIETGSATINDSAGSTTITFSGLGATISSNCAVNVSPTNLAFGNVAIGSTNTLTFVVSNMSATNCSVNGLILSGSTAFSTNTLALPIQLPPGSQVEIGVRYKPSAIGADTGTLQVVTGDPVNPIVAVALTGNGLEPSINLSTNNLQFGQLPAGSNVTLNVWLTNSGEVIATIYSISLSGSLNFTLDPIVPRSQFELTNNASVLIPVTYVTPPYPSTDAGAIIISNNSPVSPQIVLLNGTSLQSLLSLSLNSWSFGNVVIGNTNSAAVTIRNTGNTNGTVEAVEVDGSGQFITSPTAPILIGPGSSTNLNIRYIPANLQTLILFGGAVTSSGKPTKVSP